MIDVDADKSSGVIRISFCGKVTAGEAEQWVKEVFGAVDGMSPGFRLLADLSGLESMDVACAPFLGKVMDHCNERGIKKVVRIIPNPRKDIGLKILSVFHYDRQVRIVTCENLAEGEAALGQSGSSDQAVL